METEGKVIRRDEKTAVVQIRRKGACGENCAHCSGCEAQIMDVNADCEMAVNLGEWVKIRSNPWIILFGFFIVFILPIVLPLIAYFLAAGSGLEIWLVVLAIFLSLVFVLLLNKSDWFKRASRPQVIEVIVKARNKNE